MHQVQSGIDSARSDKEGGTATQSDLVTDSKIDSIEKFETTYMNSKCYEKVSYQQAKTDSERRTLEIKDLMKVYANGTKAVNKVNLKMFVD